MKRILALIVLACWSAQAATYYVATDGNNSHTKAQAQSTSTPWRTIAYGVSQLTGGDTLILRGGTYQEPSITLGSNINGPNNSTRTIIKSYPGERAVFRPTSHTVSGLQTTAAFDGPRNLTLDGWTIDFRLKDIEQQRNSNDAVPSVANLKFQFATNITFTNMHFINNTNGSLTQIYPMAADPYRGPGGNVLVSSCLFSNVHRIEPEWATLWVTPKHPIYWNTLRDTVIENSTFINGPPHLQAQGITFYGGQMATNLVVRNNYIEGFVDGIYLNAYNAQVYNNVIVHSSIIDRSVPSHGHGMGQGTRYSLYANNTIYSTAGIFGIYAQGFRDSFVNNIIWGTWSKGIMTWESSTGGLRYNNFTNNITVSANFALGAAYETGTLYSNPQLADAPTDFRIGQNSPARATGINLSSVFDTDHYSNSRTAPWDRGAFLFNSQAPEEEEPPIVDPDPLPLVSPSQSGPAYELGPIAGTFTITRAGSTAGALDVVFAMSGTAVSNVNYTLDPVSPVTISDGQASTTVTLTPINLSTIGSQTATLTIQADADYTVSSVNAATMEIFGSGIEQRPFRISTGTSGAARIR